MNFDTVPFTWATEPPEGKEVIEAMVRANCNEDLATLRRPSQLIIHIVSLSGDIGDEGPQVIVKPNKKGDGFALNYVAKPECIEVVLDKGPFAGKTVKIQK